METRMRKLKSLESLKNATLTWTVEENGVSRPATEADKASVRSAFAAALAQGNVTVNGKPVSPDGKIRRK
jgi:hypothetical protein